MDLFENGIDHELFIPKLQLMLGNLGIAKGAVCENIVATMLVHNYPNLYYFERNSTLEIDFILSMNHKRVGIEVKSSQNTKSKSLSTLMNEKQIDKGIRLSTKNVSSLNHINYLPIFLAGQL